MITIAFPKDVATAIRGSHSLLVVAPQAVYRGKTLPTPLGAAIERQVAALTANQQPGDLGALFSTLIEDSSQRLYVGLLPDHGSRYNSAARAEAIRKVVTAANLATAKRATVVLILDSSEHILPAVNAIARSLPLFSMKSGAAARTKVNVVAIDRRGTFLRVSKLARETANATRRAAMLVDMPPTDLNPEALAREARAMLRGIANVRIKEIVGGELSKAGLRGLHAVGRCAIKQPRLLIATYSPPRPKGAAVALVGKGITYDTGGLHLKARGAMESMKGDMGGAAATLGAFRVLASTGCPRQVHLLLCLAENAIGPAAYKPDDVLTLHSGKTVEINNTDAEGRLVLVDGVSYAARVLRVATIIDAATLTGAQLVATGVLHAAIISNDAKLEHLLVAAGHASGDLVHPLPFAPEFYQSEFASPIADMRNSVKNRSNAQSSCAAQFIHAHIDDADALWAHVDLAGPAWRFDRGTGFGVALLSEAVRRLP